jgi:hypothetical protein
MSRRLLGFVLLGLLAAGCNEELETEYGSRTGTAAVSVNGTSVLAEMFKQAGYSISGASWVGPKLAKGADVIVWFPDCFALPEAKQRRWFEDWLCAQPDRTLVYVGRDYDAAIAYWKAALKLASAEQKEAVRRELRRAEIHFSVLRLGLAPKADCDWFSESRERRHRQVHALSGNRDWLAGIDPKLLDIELNGRLVPGRDAVNLLTSAPDVLVSERQFCASKLLIVANGSFLLNFPLVNHENRKLAGKLIESVGSQRRVAFLESGPEGLDVYAEEPESVGRSGLAILVTEPFDIPILHLAVAGIVFCLARFPIFGRPRAWQPEALADFGAHIAALGKLLAATKDRAFALAALATYQRSTHVGASRGGRPVPPPPQPPSTAPASAGTPPTLSPTPEDPRTP